jgi:hypothetical protein
MHPDDKRLLPAPPPSFWLHFTAGGLAGTIGAAVTCPLEVVKTRLQSSLYQAPLIVSENAGLHNLFLLIYRLKESGEIRVFARQRSRVALE